jgi:proteasome accessory factor A
MGIESEYAFSASRVEGAPPLDDVRALAQQLVEIVRERHAWLPDRQSSGMFLANGARFYVDAGDHPEYCTPECSAPAEVVGAVAAGARIIEDARVELERRSKRTIAISHRNVDYRSGRTWGCHESYSHKCPPERVWDELMPHLVTRVVYTGAGGFDARGPDNVFQISPRVPHLRLSLSGCSTSRRAILHTKDEPLCRENVHRLHLICGEALYSQRASILKLGTTALVLRLIDAGLEPGGDLSFARPLAAMRTFSRDTTLRRRMGRRTGRAMSALEGAADAARTRRGGALRALDARLGGEPVSRLAAHARPARGRPGVHCQLSRLDGQACALRAAARRARAEDSGDCGAK